MQRLYFRRIGFALFPLVFPGCLWAADSTAGHSATLMHGGDPAGSAATGPLGRPALGFVAQVAPLELRAIFGVPGSAVLSDPLVLPRAATRLHLAPGQGYALVERSNGDPLVLPLASAAVAFPIAGALQTTDFAAFSPKGRSAVLYSVAQSRLQVIGGLPDSPQIALDLNTSAFVEQPLDAAVSDDAGTVLLTSAGAVYQLLPGNLPRQLISVDGAAAFTFLPDSRQAAIADRGTGSVYLWQGEGGSASQLAGGLTGVGEIRPSSDGLGLWLTNPAASAVLWINVKTAEQRTFTMPISPSKLDGLAYPDMFLLASDPGQPAWFLFQQGGGALASFVPAVKDKKPAIPGEEVHK